MRAFGDVPALAGGVCEVARPTTDAHRFRLRGHVRRHNSQRLDFVSDPLLGRHRDLALLVLGLRPDALQFAAICLAALPGDDDARVDVAKEDGADRRDGPSRLLALRARRWKTVPVECLGN